jgi:FkbM family methyltransferase
VTHLSKLVRRVRRRVCKRLGIRLAAEWSELPDDRATAMANFYSQFVKAGELCFDIGANVGDYVQVFRKLGCPVVAVEPQSACVKALRRRFRKAAEVVVLQRAVCDRETELTLHLGDADTLSSVSTEWMAKVVQTGRFGALRWRGTETVATLTMDTLIETYGQPAFIKVDVEGYEFEVLRGLSQPVKHLSFEWTPEFSNSLTKCITHLTALGKIETNYSLGRFSLESKVWLPPEDLLAHLNAIEFYPQLHGDVYVRFIGL